MANFCFVLGNEVCAGPSPSPSPTPSSTANPSSIDRQAAIIGGVIGGVFGIALLALLIVCCVWYQFFNKSDPAATSNGRKSDFNFTDIKVATVNKTAIELKGVEPVPEEGVVSPVEPEPEKTMGSVV